MKLQFKRKLNNIWSVFKGEYRVGCLYSDTTGRYYLSLYNSYQGISLYASDLKEITEFIKKLQKEE